MNSRALRLFEAPLQVIGSKVEPCRLARGRKSIELVCAPTRVNSSHETRMKCAARSCSSPPVEEIKSHSSAGHWRAGRAHG